MTMSITFLEFHINLMGSFEKGKNLFSVNRPELQGSMNEIMCSYIEQRIKNRWNINFIIAKMLLIYK